MSSLILPAQRTALAESIYDAIEASSSNYYLFVGKPLPWEDSDATVVDPINTEPYLNQVRADMVYMKKIQPSDCAFMVEKREWTTGTVYDQYDDSLGKTVTFAVGDQSGDILTGSFDASLFGQNWLVTGTNIAENTRVFSGDDSSITLDTTPTGTVTEVTLTAASSSGATALKDATFYVVNSTGKVYKCLYNDDGAESTVEPTTTSAEPVTSLDGYRWKYMFTVPSSVMDEFGTPTQIPVGEAAWPTAVGIYNIVTMHSGTGYSSATVTIDGDGTGATAVANLLGDEVLSVTMTNFGTGYHWATVTISGDGTGADARAVLCPVGGHAANPARELVSTDLRLSTTLVHATDTNQGFTGNNEYRQTGIIKDPLDYSTGAKFTGMAASPCFVVTGDFVYANVAQDEILTDSDGKRYRVVDKPASDPAPDDVGLLVQSLDNAVPVVSQVLEYDATNATLTEVTLPDVDKYTGAILFVDTRTNYQTTAEQNVSFKSTLRF